MFPCKLLELSPERTQMPQYCSPDNYYMNTTYKKTACPRSYFKQQLLEETNAEGDLIIKECNRFVENAISPIDIFQKIALEPKKNRSSGYLKFFDENKNYGFIVMDSDNTDIFVYADDLAKTGLQKDFLRTAKYGNTIRFTFICMDYVGKYNKSRKAVDLEYLNSQPAAY